MKKKLLVLVLIVAIVLSLVACDWNAAPDDWNYFKEVFASADRNLNEFKADGFTKRDKDIRLQTMVYLQLQEMYTTGGKFLVWFANYKDPGAAASAKAINNLAIKYDVPVVYHFDPVLDGGWGKDQGHKTSWDADYNADLRTDIGAISTKYGILRQELVNIFGGGNATVMAENLTNKLVYFAGAAIPEVMTEEEWAASGMEGTYVDYVDGLIDSVSGFAADFIGSIRVEGRDNPNKFGGGSKQFAKEDVVLSSCDRVPNTSTAVENPKRPDTEDKATGVIVSRQFFSTVTPFDYFSDERLMIGDGDFLTPSNSVFKNITYHQFMLMLGQGEKLDADGKPLPGHIRGYKGDFLVHFGGAWCPNTKAMAWLVNNWAKRYGIETVYLFDPVLDGNNQTGVNIRSNDGANANNFTYTGLYADLLLALGGKFESQWNKVDFVGGLPSYTIRYDKGIAAYKAAGGTVIKVGETEYLPRMCVPNLMLLNNKHNDKTAAGNKIIGQLEVEYYYSATSDPNSRQRFELDEALGAVKTGLIARHKLAFAAPIELVEEDSGSGSSGGGGPELDAC